MNRTRKIHALCMVLFMSFVGHSYLMAQNLIDEVSAHGRTLTENYTFPDWNDVEFVFEDESGLFASNDYSIYIHSSKNTEVGILKVITNIIENSTLCFEASLNDGHLSIFIDGVETETYSDEDLSGQNMQFVELIPGRHEIELKIVKQATASASLNLGIRKSPCITVNLFRPGSMATEILYNVDRMQDVRKLKVIGEMNEEDMEKLSTVKEGAFEIDLSEATFPNGVIQRNAFYNAPFLHTMRLPEGLKSIGYAAFKLSQLKNISFPSTLESISSECFYGCKFREIVLNEKCSSLESAAFSSCTKLQKIVFSNAIKTIPGSCFYNCTYLHDITLPENLESIGSQAFYGCNKYSKREMSLIIPESCVYFGGGAFSDIYCDQISFPSTFYELNNYYGGGSLCAGTIEKIRLNCASVVNVTNFMPSSACAETILEVPDYLVIYYKQDPYWYQFKEIRGFSTVGIREWIVRGDLTMDARVRWSDEPNTIIKSTGSMSIYGTNPLTLGDLVLEGDMYLKKYGRLINNGDNLVVNGDVQINEYMQNGKWYYISLPFNVKVGDITFADGEAQKAVRRYDGANRASNGTGNNWVNYAANDIIPAGTGFIFQSSADGTWQFPAQDDASKAYISDFRMFVKQLAANTSSTPSDNGWNLVGNPYQCWYNIHKLNFTAPITVRNANFNGYEAYSIIDDDYALAPNQAFFVQCPEGTTEISFPLNGRQMTSEITSQNGAPALNGKPVTRRLVDITLSDGANCDRTRVVLNEKASEEYEIACDASKMMGDASVPQLYTIDRDGTQYAINERPLSDGTVEMTAMLPADGTYTLSLTRNRAGRVLLTDNETGETIQLSASEYTFDAEAGTRTFTLMFEADGETGINAANADSTSGIYTISGVKVNGTNALPAGAYIIKSGSKSHKAIIK